MTKKIVKKVVEVPEPEIVSGPRLVSYKITATIRTGEYQNVIPEIMVEGGTIDEARTILTKEIDTLKAKYDPNVRKVVAPAVAPQPTTQAPVEPQGVQKSEPFLAAEKVIVAAKSIGALDMIETQIDKSVKLSGDEKDELKLKIIELRKEFHANNPA